MRRAAVATTLLACSSQVTGAATATMTWHIAITLAVHSSRSLSREATIDYSGAEGRACTSLSQRRIATTTPDLTQQLGVCLGQHRLLARVSSMPLP